MTTKNEDINIDQFQKDAIPDDALVIYGERTLTASGSHGLAVTIPMPVIRKFGLKKGRMAQVMSKGNIVAIRFDPPEDSDISD